MTHNISTFVASAKSGNGFLHPNQFDLQISAMPKWSQGEFDGRNIQFQCNSASLPGTNIDSIDVRRYGQGLLEYFPTGVSFFDLQTTFYADQNAEIIRFFNRWTKNIIAFDDDTTSAEKFRAFYRNNYISQLVVNQYSTEATNVLSYTYIDAFPVVCEPIGVRWFSRDEVMEFSVTWKYRNWKETVSPLSRQNFPQLGLQVPSQITGLPGYSMIAGQLPNIQTVLGSNPKIQQVINTVPKVQNALNTGNAIVKGFLGR